MGGYRARDAKLGRDDDQILPGCSARSGRRARFEREARLLASLNHPNILAIHDVGMADGSRLRHRVLVGRTPRELIIDERPAISRLVDLAAQVADGSAAHRKASCIGISSQKMSS
jgi:serine/threonine-protein kinase